MIKRDVLYGRPTLFLKIFKAYLIIVAICDTSKWRADAVCNIISDHNHPVSTRIIYEPSATVSRPGLDVNLTMKFAWSDIHDSTVGFLIKLKDVDRDSSRLVSSGSPTFSFNSTKWGQSECSKAGEKYQLLNLASQANARCGPFPCISAKEKVENLCCLLNKGYKVFSKNTTSITKQIDFGRKYELDVIQYAAGGIDPDNFDVVRPEPIFCRQELITRHNITFDEADRFCAREQTIATSMILSGPPVDVQEFHATVDVATNRGEVTYQWRKPYDVAPGASFEGFDVTILHQTSPFINTRTWSSEDGFYYFSASNVTFDQPFQFNITPRLSLCAICADHGLTFSHFFILPDINVCNATSNSTAVFCDSLATCVDLPPESLTPAKCQCPIGYVGNGISQNITGGTGCVEDSYCPSELCHHNAICWDAMNVTNSSRCSCPYFYFGDGMQEGKGCTPISLPLGVGLGMVGVIAATVMITLWIRQARARKIRKMKLSFSKYLDDGDFGEEASQGGIIQNLLGNKWEIKLGDLELGEVIGRGGFGVVRKANLRRSTHVTTVAVKCFPDAIDATGREQFMAEIALMSTVGSHPNVIGMIGFCPLDDCQLSIVVEYMKYGDLLSFLWDARKAEKRDSDPIYNITEFSVRKIAKQCANGLKYLKRIKIIHGDVAARNVLVSENLRCKLSDFGLSSDVYCIGKITEAKERKLPVKWVSPERMTVTDAPITWRSDVWSFGVLLYEIVTLGASPYPEIPNNHLFSFLQQGNRMAKPLSCSQEIYDMMLRCWQWEPEKRPSYDSIAHQLINMQSKSSNGHIQHIDQVEDDVV